MCHGLEVSIQSDLGVVNYYLHFFHVHRSAWLTTSNGPLVGDSGLRLEKRRIHDAHNSRRAAEHSRRIV